MTLNLHAHLSSRTVDCDGPLDSAWVMSMTDAERADEQFGDLEFKRRLLGAVVNTAPMHTGQLSVTSFDDGTARFEWSEATDEGSRSIDALTCTDETCNPDAYSQRDHFAEAMGY